MGLPFLIGVLLTLLVNPQEKKIVVEEKIQYIHEAENAYKNPETYEKELWGISQIYKERIEDTKICDIGEKRVLNRQAHADETPHKDFETEIETPIYDLGYMRVGENLARRYQLPSEAFQGWLGSPSHKASLDNPNYTHSCISCHYFEDESSMYCVQLFAGY